MNTTTHTITENTTLGELLAMLGDVTKAGKTPTSRMLREKAGEPIATEERCKVYANGYAVYDNGSGRTVVWIPSCVAYRYQFDPMKETEKGYGIAESLDLPEGLLESLPWPMAITLIGDHRIERLSLQRKADRRQNRSLIRGDNEEGDAQEDMIDREDSLAKEYTWEEGRVGEDPATTLIRRETRKELLESLTKDQREAFILYFRDGFTQDDIADMLQISRSSVRDRLNHSVKKAKKIISDTTILTSPTPLYEGT